MSRVRKYYRVIGYYNSDKKKQFKITFTAPYQVKEFVESNDLGGLVFVEHTKFEKQTVKVEYTSYEKVLERVGKKGGKGVYDVEKVNKMITRRNKRKEKAELMK